MKKTSPADCSAGLFYTTAKMLSVLEIYMVGRMNFN